MTLEDLAGMIDRGEFHHATYRCIGSLWEGLWIYRRAADGFRGYEPAGSFPKGSEGPAQKMLMERGVGTHVGAYGHG